MPGSLTRGCSLISAVFLGHTFILPLYLNSAHHWLHQLSPVWSEPGHHQPQTSVGVLLSMVALVLTLENLATPKL